MEQRTRRPCGRLNRHVGSRKCAYALKVPGTDTWIPLDRFGEPFSLFWMIADMGMYAGYMSRADQDAGFGAWVGIAASGLFNASFARGIYDSMGILRNEDQDYVLSQQARNYGRHSCHLDRSWRQLTG